MFQTTNQMRTCAPKKTSFPLENSLPVNLYQNLYPASTIGGCMMLHFSQFRTSNPMLVWFPRSVMICIKMCIVFPMFFPICSSQIRHCLQFSHMFMQFPHMFPTFSYDFPSFSCGFPMFSESSPTFSAAPRVASRAPPRCPSAPATRPRWVPPARARLPRAGRPHRRQQGLQAIPSAANSIAHYNTLG